MNQNEQCQKAERAANALKAVGIVSARPGDGDYASVTVSPQDAMKMLLLTDSDAARVLESERKIRLGVKQEIEGIKKRIDRLERLANHSPDLCQKGEHILDSWATGGRSGHVRTICLACDFSQDGYD